MLSGGDQKLSRCIPKRILTEVIRLYRLTCFQCQQIIASSNETHIYRSRCYRHKTDTMGGWIIMRSGNLSVAPPIRSTNIYYR